MKIQTENNRISTRQLTIITIVALYSPITRLFPAVAAKQAAQAGWVSPILAAVAVLLLVKIFAALYGKGDDGPANYADMLELAFGKIVSKAILVFYAIWVALLFLLYVRYFAEQMLSTMFTTADISFFIVVMMSIVLFAARGRIEAFARFSEISFIVFAVTLIFIAVCLIPTFDARNVLPVTQVDIKPILKGTYPMFSIMGYFTLFFFLGDHLSGKDKIWKYGARGALSLGCIATIITAICLATLGHHVSRRMPMPFFSTTKLINVIQPLDRMEAVVLCAWVISDFIIITAFAFILMNIAKKLFNAREARYFATPVAFFGVVGGIFFVTSRFELEAFSESLLCIGTNIVSGFGIPVVTLVVGKLRGKL